MQRLSLQVTDRLYQDLSLKAQEHELSLSDTMRECLQLGIKHFRQQIPSIAPTQKSDISLQKRIATHTLFTYCIVENFIRSTVENGNQLCDAAEAKAEKLTLAMLQKAFKTES